jgi:alkylated DNA repair dioxygenase AlkB
MSDRTAFTTIDLGAGHHLQTSQLPNALVWDTPAFEQAWLLHPTVKHEILMHGRMVATPRWQQAYGMDYHYTGNVNRALDVPPLLSPLLTWVRTAFDDRLNAILVNWYEGPGHYIGPHHDNVKHMVYGAPIVTMSFGETRVFRLTKGTGVDRKVVDFAVPNGTVIVMPYDTNLAWKHSVPKSTRYLGRRISVTFRAFNMA